VNSKRVVVVGTTGDYIGTLEERAHGRIVFLTDTDERRKWTASGSPEFLEATCSLGDRSAAVNILKHYVEKHGAILEGVACFDCESLRLASLIAREFSLDFPSEEAVLRCRSKFQSKEIWLEQGVGCPQAEMVLSAEQASSFYRKVNRPVVLKPLTGSGSELVFLCRDENACRQAYECIASHVKRHPNQRMFGAESCLDHCLPHQAVTAETFIGGDEYSCDFVLEGGHVDIIRLSKKIPFKSSTFGTILAYEVRAQLPFGLNEKDLSALLAKAATALGLKRTMAMVDLKIEHGKIYLLELTPRPGGDCLPPLIEESSGFDILLAALDFAQGKRLLFPERRTWRPLVGVQIFADRAGTVEKLSAEKALQDPRVVKCHFKREKGHVVNLPPDDYDSRSLGYLIFEPSATADLEKQSMELLNKLHIDIKV